MADEIIGLAASWKALAKKRWLELQSLRAEIHRWRTATESAVARMELAEIKVWQVRDSWSRESRKNKRELDSLEEVNASLRRECATRLGVQQELGREVNSFKEEIERLKDMVDNTKMESFAEVERLKTAHHERCESDRKEIERLKEGLMRVIRKDSRTEQGLIASHALHGTREKGPATAAELLAEFNAIVADIDAKAKTILAPCDTLRFLISPDPESGYEVTFLVLVPVDHPQEECVSRMTEFEEWWFDRRMFSSASIVVDLDYRSAEPCALEAGG